MTIRPTRTVPVLRMFDEAMTRAFYVDFLEFEVAFEHRFEPTMPLYLGVKKGDIELNLSGHFGDANPGGAVRIEMTGLDEYAQRLGAKQYKHARPGAPEDKEWGCRELSLQDPSGNRLIFFMYLPKA